MAFTVELLLLFLVSQCILSRSRYFVNTTVLRLCMYGQGIRTLTYPRRKPQYRAERPKRLLAINSASLRFNILCLPGHGRDPVGSTLSFIKKKVFCFYIVDLCIRMNLPYFIYIIYF